MPVFERPSAISASTSCSRGVSRSSGPSRRLAREQLRHHLRVERGAAAGDPAHRLDELDDVQDAVLEQVAHAAAAVGEQLLGVGLLDVLGDHEDRRVRATACAPRARRADPRRGSRAAGGCPRPRCRACARRSRAAAHRRRARRRRPRSRCRAAGARARRAAARGPRRSLPAWHLRAHRRRARRRGLATRSVPSSASTRRRRPLRPPPSGSAPPTPSSATSTLSMSPSRIMRIVHALRARECLPALASASATTK